MKREELLNALMGVLNPNLLAGKEFKFVRCGFNYTITRVWLDGGLIMFDHIYEKTPFWNSTLNQCCTEFIEPFVNAALKCARRDVNLF